MVVLWSTAGSAVLGIKKSGRLQVARQWRSRNETQRFARHRAVIKQKRTFGCAPTHA
jgi:hypothetical protein